MSRLNFSRVLKRFVDITVASAALVMLSPVISALAVLLLVLEGRPIFFSQQRAGFLGQPFNITKFRTMRNREAVNDVSEDDRISPFGRWLRSTSLDELPQLFHVLSGAMSLVGPRPLHMAYLERYTPEEGRRHEVKPGLTGWAQVNGRNALSWDDKLRLDVWYVEHHTLILDVKIMAMTVVKIISREAVNNGDDKIMPEFRPPAGSIEPPTPQVTAAKPRT